VESKYEDSTDILALDEITQPEDDDEEASGDDEAFNKCASTSCRDACVMPLTLVWKCRCISRALASQRDIRNYAPVKASRKVLESMKHDEVFMCTPPGRSMRATFYKNMLPDIAIALSQPCQRYNMCAYLCSRI
jgi:hypothetical protein